jgi:hypothetical protein
MDMRECIEACSDCHDACAALVAHCLKMGGKHASRDHIVLLIDCADTCRISTDFMLRHSPRHALTCGNCEKVCTACAEDCERFPDDKEMARCAQICRRCAKLCGAMAKQAA